MKVHPRRQVIEIKAAPILCANQFGAINVEHLSMSELLIKIKSLQIQCHYLEIIKLKEKKLGSPVQESIY